MLRLVEFANSLCKCCVYVLYYVFLGSTIQNVSLFFLVLHCCSSINVAVNDRKLERNWKLKSKLFKRQNVTLVRTDFILKVFNIIRQCTVHHMKMCLHSLFIYFFCNFMHHY